MILDVLRNRAVTLRKTHLLISTALILVSLPACAELGSSVASVQNDQAKLKGSLQVTKAAGYEIHAIQTAQGAAVREYVSPSGTVFGVAWSGRFNPDLRQLLGPYFDQYVNAAEQTKRTTRGPATIQLPGLVVQRGGHQGLFFGRAYIPQMIPAGVSADEVK